jgi:diguanylate cyclase (GGDEF)-like protein
MVRKLDEISQGVRGLAEAYGRGYREQRRLVRLSDRMQEELQAANRHLTEQATELRSLNAALEKEIEERERLAKELERLATIDELTGLYGRRHFMALAERELARRRRTGVPIIALMLDLDHFKRVNDTHGHAVGDLVLRELGAVMRAGLRELDVAGRMGGEEFAVLLSDTTDAQGLEIAERLRATMERRQVSQDNGPAVSCTVSIGVALQKYDESLDDLLNRADGALYAAKRGGRNCVAVAGTRAGPEYAKVVDREA